jgi:hypothetical protein
MCRSNDALIRESHQQMSQMLSHLEERQREVRTTMGLETPSTQSTLLFLFPMWKIIGLGTSTLMMMVKMMMKSMMRSKRSPSEDIVFHSLFLVLDAKEGEVLSI